MHLEQLVERWEQELGRTLSRGELIDMLCDNTGAATQAEYDAILAFVDVREGGGTTRDMLTGKPFKWNTTVVYYGKVVPAICTARKADHLHPDRVPPILLVALNTCYRAKPTPRAPRPIERRRSIEPAARVAPPILRKRG